MAATTCFFCQNLLSDFIEGYLPAERHANVKEHLANCTECSQVERNLKDTIGVLQEIPRGDLGSEIRDRFWDASRTGGRVWGSRIRVSRWIMISTVPVLTTIVFFILFPQAFPWKNILSDTDDESQYVRFFPLMQGASEIVDEQTSWLHGRDLEGGSLWDEGGISPDEFERVFQPGHREVAP